MMDIDTLMTTLGGQKFFEGLQPEQMVVLASTAEEVEYGGGVEIFEEGGDANAAYLILEEGVALELHVAHRAHHIVQTLHEGEVLGWSWLIEPHIWKFDARAVTPVRMISIDGKCLRGKCEQDFELGYRLFQRVARLMEARLSATRLQLLDLYQQEGAQAAQ